MYNFGKKSIKQLDTLHNDLQIILLNAINYFDFSILEGIRTQDRQLELFKAGRSQLDGVKRKSKHQGRKNEDGEIVSFAVDLYPYYKGFDAFNHESGSKMFYYMAGLMMSTADRLFESGVISHKLRWGGNWDSDMDLFGDSSFFDLPHFELIKP